MALNASCNISSDLFSFRLHDNANDTAPCLAQLRIYEPSGMHDLFDAIEGCIRHHYVAGSLASMLGYNTTNTPQFTDNAPLPAAEIDAVTAGSSLLLVLLLAIARMLLRWWRRWRLHRIQIFLSYRVATESTVVEALYRLLTEKYHLNVWWDKECLVDGEKWEDGFADGLFGSRIFVPFLSKAALAPFAKLGADSNCDNVLLEHLVAILQFESKLLNAIFPIFIGSVVDEVTGERANFFGEGGMPEAGDDAVSAVDAKALEHLKRRSEEQGKEETVVELLVAERSPKAVLKTLTAHQGDFLRGVEPDADHLERIAMKIDGMARKLASGRTVKRGHDGGLLLSDEGSLASGRSGRSGGSRLRDDDDDDDGSGGGGSGWGLCPWPITCFLGWVRWLVCLSCWQRARRPAGSLPAPRSTVTTSPCCQRPGSALRVGAVGGTGAVAEAQRPSP